MIWGIFGFLFGSLTGLIFISLFSSNISKLNIPYEPQVPSQTFRQQIANNSTNPRIFCWVPSRTSSGPILDIILQTWADSCDYFMFSSTSANPGNKVQKFELPSNQLLWNIIHPVWTYIEENYANDYDWFVKLDDDTYFSADNFRNLVKEMNPDDLYYLGHKAFEFSKPLHDPNGEFNLGAGHALSRGSLKKLSFVLPDSKKPLPPGLVRCPRIYSWAEDVILSECLFKVGILPNNTRDLWGRENFISFPPLDNFMTVRRPDSISWFWRGKPKWVQSGAHCCSSRPILWHGMKKERTREIYAIEYLLYNIMIDPSQVN